MKMTIKRLRGLLREALESHDATRADEFRDRIYAVLDQLEEFAQGSYAYEDVPMHRLAELGISPEEWAQHGDDEQDASLSWHVDETNQTVSFFLD